MPPRRKTLVLLLLATALPALSVRAETRDTGIRFRSVTVGATTYRYEVYVPPTWTPQKKWPVILFLHGAGHRGEYAPNSNASVLARLFLSYQKQTRALVVFPRCWAGAWWSDPDMEAMALGALRETMKEYNGDSERVYLTGLSMGGYGVWYIAARHPGTFAALAPVSGGVRKPRAIPIPAVSTLADPYAGVAGRIVGTAVGVSHGSAADPIDVGESGGMVEALRRAGGHVLSPKYKGVSPTAWARAYREPEFFPGLLSHRLHPAATPAA